MKQVKKQKTKNKKEVRYYFNHYSIKKQNKNYLYWRSLQRKQLGISANLYMIFASAILGFILTIFVKTGNIDIEPKLLLIICVGFLLLSLLFHGLFMDNRLRDFRETARLLKDGKSESETAIRTRKDGEQTWGLYHLQLLFLILGFVFALIGLGFLIL